MATASERVPLLGQAPECRGTASRGAAQSPEPVARYCEGGGLPRGGCAAGGGQRRNREQRKKENSSKASLFSPSRLMMLRLCFQGCCSLSLFDSIVPKWKAYRLRLGKSQRGEWETPSKETHTPSSPPVVISPMPWNCGTRKQRGHI